MIEPPSFRSGNAFCTVNSVPLTLMLNSLSKCSSVTAPKGTNFANAGVGENNIESALHVRDGPVETIKVIQSGDVSLNAINVAAESLYGGVEFLLAAARDEDIRTLLGEKFFLSQTHPFAPARC